MGGIFKRVPKYLSPRKRGSGLAWGWLSRGGSRTAPINHHAFIVSKTTRYLLCFGVRQILIKNVFNIQNCLVKPLLSLLLLYRRLRYGYAFRKIPLTRGKFAIVDPEDYPRLAKYKWFLAKSPTGSYATRWQRLKNKNARKRIWMHREIIHIPKHMVCDHKNRNGLDNRKANLRPATVSQNLCNRSKRRTKTRSKYKGLEWDKIQRKWKARIQLNGRKIYLGSFAGEIDAAKAYDKAAKKYHGEFAALNFEQKQM